MVCIDHISQTWSRAKFLIAGVRSVCSVKKAFDNDFGTIPRPIAVYFEATYACTCKCVFCQRWVNGSKNVKQELTYSQIIDIIDQSFDLGVRMIGLSGGEPLLKEGILEAMVYAREKGMITTVTHNGTLIDQKNVDDVLSAFDVINISIDSLISEKHDGMRGVRGTFEKAIDAVDLLKEHSKSTTINVQSILTAENIEDIGEINRHFAGSGVGTYFQPLHDISDSGFRVRNEKLKAYEIGKLKSMWRSFIKGYKYPNSMAKHLFRGYYEKTLDFLIDPLSAKRHFNCFAGSFSFFINPYGEVYPCDLLRMSMGNVGRKSLEEIWSDRGNRDLRYRIKNRECNCWILCSAPLFINISRFVR